MYYEIKTSRLLLRPLDISDLETVHVYASDKKNTTYMFWLPNKNIEETSNFLKKVTYEWQKESPEFYEFAIVLDDLQIGAISVYLNETRGIGELGWIINKRYWKKGIASEASSAIKEFAFNVLRLEKIVAHCDYRNVASYNLMQRMGMILENDTGLRIYPKSNETVKELTYSLVTNRMT